MKIICTKEEKESLVFIIKDSNYCTDIMGECDYANCDECIDACIEWEIKDGDGE